MLKTVKKYYIMVFILHRLNEKSKYILCNQQNGRQDNNEKNRNNTAYRSNYYL